MFQPRAGQTGNCFSGRAVVFQQCAGAHGRQASACGYPHRIARSLAGFASRRAPFTPPAAFCKPSPRVAVWRAVHGRFDQALGPCSPSGAVRRRRLAAAMDGGAIQLALEFRAAAAVPPLRGVAAGAEDHHQRQTLGQQASAAGVQPCFLARYRGAWLSGTALFHRQGGGRAVADFRIAGALAADRLRGPHTAHENGRCEPLRRGPAGGWRSHGAVRRRHDGGWHPAAPLPLGPAWRCARGGGRGDGGRSAARRHRLHKARRPAALHQRPHQRHRLGGRYRPAAASHRCAQGRAD